MRNNPIGIFDSGVGGLSVSRSIREALPHEDLIYIADARYAPYGEKSQDFIAQRSATLVDYLLNKNAKAIVVACNTATVSTIHKLRAQFSIPIIGVEPGIKPAVSQSRSGIVGVLATQQTVNSESFSQLKERFSAEAQIHVQPCPGLAKQIESMALECDETRTLLTRYVDPLLKQGADTLVMGCTHYAFLTPLLETIVGPDIQIINTHTAVSRQVIRRLEKAGLCSNSSTTGTERFLTSGEPHQADRLFSTLWGEPVDVIDLSQ